MTILVTGGAGFIGSALCRYLVRAVGADVVVVDKLTYAASVEALEDLPASGRLQLLRCDITDRSAMATVFAEHRPQAVVHLAAETHVDRSIEGPAAFLQTNVVGTCILLEVAFDHWRRLSEAAREAFRFLHVSTDEVYGSLGPAGAFSEGTPYAPNSPYAASKAASDHFVRAWHHTYGLPTLISNCSNNYGPYQFPEKLIPLMVIKAIAGEPLPVYGTGENVRDWLHVSDHVEALYVLLRNGRPGEKYNIGGNAERTNFELVRTLCGVLDEIAPRSDGRPHASGIAFVTDRPGHDLRYAIDASKIATDLGWQPRVTFESGLRETVAWFVANRSWWEPIQTGRYGGQRLGLSTSSFAGSS